MERIAMLQAKYGQFYEAGPTKFTHLTLEEFAAGYLGWNPA
jgi:hypothetical protein